MTYIIKEIRNEHTKRTFIFATGNKNKTGYKFRVSVTQEKEIPEDEKSEFEKAFKINTHNEEIEEKYFEDFFEADEFFDEMITKY